MNMNANKHMHSDSKKRRSSFLVALLLAAGDVKRYAADQGSRRISNVISYRTRLCTQDGILLSAAIN